MFLCKYEIICGQRLQQQDLCLSFEREQKWSNKNIFKCSEIGLSTQSKFFVFPRDIEIAPLFSVANFNQAFQALLITKGGERGVVRSEKYVMNFYVFTWRKAFSPYMST
jgi:hypothetical protein